MKSTSLNLPVSAVHGANAVLPKDAPASAKMLLKMLVKLRYGALLLTLPDGTCLHYGDNSPPMSITLKNWKLFAATLRSGDIGFAESYIDGDWSTPNLTGLMGLIIANRAALETLVYGSWIGGLVYRIKHWLNRNSKTGSRKNIHAHYDIGNDFYRLWLDPSMTYSSALFTPENQPRRLENTAGADCVLESAALEADLQLAQKEKYRRILAQLNVQPGQKVLEIGCGWGGFAELAAIEGGISVDGLTLSEEQLKYAKTRIENVGVSGKVDLRLCDYRDSNGQYDGIASIEMFEAVGEQYWPSYFATLARNLKPTGRACIQTIVIHDDLFERYRTSTDFIQQYIFPGGMLPSPSRFRAMADEYGFRVSDELCFGIDYADTLAAWRKEFHAKLDQVRAQGYDQRFIHIWEFYLCYCEAAFRANNTDVMHFTLIKK